MAQLKDTSANNVVINGNLIIKSKKIDRTLLDLIYPVGSIYWTGTNSNPSDLFGGSWEKIEGKFLLASGGNVKLPKDPPTGEITLSVDQLPQHRHSFTPIGNISSHYHTANHSHNFSGTTSSSSTNVTSIYKDAMSTGGGAHNHDYTRGEMPWEAYWSSGGQGMTGHTSRTVGKENDGNNLHQHSLSDGSHTHTITDSGHYHSMRIETKSIKSDAGGSSTGDSTPVAFTGTWKYTDTESNPNFKNGTINIIPPYIIKNCWRRTE